MKKINIAEILKSCPKGMELDCLLCNNPIELEGVVGDDAGYPIKAVGKDGFLHVFTSYGASYNHDDAKCVIFPKGKTNQDCYECDDRYALVFENQDNWELVPNKFDINTLVPFESRVLVRDFSYDVWKVSFWGCLINNGGDFIYDTTRGIYKQCVPYEGNEHLLGKTNDCDEFYKTWE